MTRMSCSSITCPAGSDEVFWVFAFPALRVQYFHLGFVTLSAAISLIQVVRLEPAIVFKS